MTWSYDGQGNLLTEATGGSTTSTYTYATSPNTVNELTSLAVSGQPTRYYSYDKYGNPLSIGPSPTNPCPSSTSTCLGYDALARLASVTEANNGPTVAMTYNAVGLRAGYTVTPYGAGQPNLSEQFTYRGGQLAQTVTISGTTSYTDTYVYSQHGMPLELLRTTNGVLNRYWYERDGLGNVVALTDSSGTVVDQYAYDLWGKPTIVYERVPQQLRYQGYWYDTELGWYWLTTRAYDPTIKRFLQPDPSEMDGLFSYVYVGDDPVDGSDPSGFGVGGHGNCGPDGIYCGAIEQEVAPTGTNDPCYYNVDLCAPEGHVTYTQIVNGQAITTGNVPMAQAPTASSSADIAQQVSSLGMASNAPPSSGNITRSGGLLLTVDNEYPFSTSNIVLEGHINNFTGSNIVLGGGEETGTELCPGNKTPIPFSTLVTLDDLGIYDGGAMNRLGPELGFYSSLSFECNETEEIGGIPIKVQVAPEQVYGDLSVWYHRDVDTSGGLVDFALDAISGYLGRPTGRWAKWSNPVPFSLGP